MAHKGKSWPLSNLYRDFYPKLPQQGIPFGARLPARYWIIFGELGGTLGVQVSGQLMLSNFHDLVADQQMLIWVFPSVGVGGTLDPILEFHFRDPPGNSYFYWKIFLGPVLIASWHSAFFGTVGGFGRVTPLIEYFSRGDTLWKWQSLLTLTPNDWNNDPAP